MKIHCFLHVDFETPGYIVDWAEWNDFEVSYTHIYNNDPFPELEDFGCVSGYGRTDGSV